jgi:hypothetical protein
MANTPKKEVLRISSRNFKHFLENKGVSIRNLERMTGESERSIRSHLKKGEMPISSFFKISDYMDWTIKEIALIVWECPFLTCRKYAEWMEFLVKRDMGLRFKREIKENEN